MSYSAEVSGQVAYEVAGTCDTHTQDYFDLHGITHDEFDEILINEGIFLCDSCGWFCYDDESNVINGDQVCDDCVIEESTSEE
jgi:formylmethanofuran dehydrogenase subunit E